MLGAVSLLGSDLPACLNLDDILSLYTSNHDFSSVECFTNKKTCDTIISNEIKSINEAQTKMDAAKLQFKLEESEKQNTKLSDQLKKQNESIEQLRNDFKAITEQKEAAEAKVLEAAKKEKEAQVDKFITEITADKLCTKAMQPLVKELFTDKVEKFSIGDKEGDKYELVKEILKFSSEAGKVNFDDKTSNDNDSKLTDTAKVEKYAKENNVSFREAYSALAKQA